jgi:adenine-specific DNA methylase
MTKAKKLIEVAMPIKEISAESVRDKSIRHGHISTLHLWWARRPLPVCRAVIFASLVPDPLDEQCSQAFKDAIQDLLGNDPLYAPYPDIPYTAIYDPMPDNLRNRLLMFIGKFSPVCQANMLKGKNTASKEQLSEGCLIKWESKNDKVVLTKARKLIWVAYNAGQNPDASFVSLSQSFDAAYQAIEEAENNLYSCIDRHLETDTIKEKETALQAAIDCFQRQMPSVLDPFAGVGAIPLEAARLGCRSYGNDINPVAHIIEKGSVEFPQKYGKPIRYTEEEFRRIYGKEGIDMLIAKGISISNGIIDIPNRLSFDVEYYAKQLLAMTEKEVGYLYPADENGNKPIAYYWARTATCSNPSCKAEVPLLKQFYLANTSSKKVYLNPVINGTDIQFEIKEGVCPIKDGWNNRGNMTCPCCGSITTADQLKEQFKAKQTGERFLAIITESSNGKKYKPSNFKDVIAITANTNKPTENMPTKYTQAFPSCTWGYSMWGDLFSNRQLFMLQSFVNNFSILKTSFKHTQYIQSLLTYLAIWIDRIAVANTSLGRWHNGRETIEHPFSRQAIAMVFDYPESNPFCSSSGSATNQLEWILRYIESESNSSFYTNLKNASSGEKSQFGGKQLTAVVTDPPYYDAIAYADISDFFYVWLKRTLNDTYSLNFSTPQTPKSEECTALKHHHNNSEQEAKLYFEKKLTDIFDAIEQQTSDIVSIMFAHQTTEAWTTLCNSILSARMNITGSWPMDTEMANRSLGLASAALESSVTVSCRPSERSGYGSFKQVKQAIEEKVNKEVEKLYGLGFRGADLLTACFGQAVSEFGKYEKVEKADGSEVTVAELLELAKTAAFNALLRGFDGDEYTKFYIGWLQMNGMGETDFDDAAKFTRIGMNINVSDIFHHHLLIKNGNKQHLASYIERITGEIQGTNISDPLIDQVQQAMMLWSKENRPKLLRHIKLVGSETNNSFWRVLASLKELLSDGDDLKQVNGLLANSEELIQSCQKDITGQATQMNLGF